MPEANAFSVWYTSLEETERANEAHDVFKQALSNFTLELSKDEKKLRWIVDSKHGNIESVVASIHEARVCYEARKGNSKVRKALAKLSEKMYSYSGIMDALFSQQPEYTTLAYGAMKVLLVGVVNHQKLLSQLCAGLNSIAHIIPRAQRIMQLYPIQQIKQIIMEVYVQILKFLLRALRWYQASKITHMLHAIKVPTKLQYNDILTNISLLSKTLSMVASDSSHAEQRDMHTSITQIIHEQHHLREEMTELVGAVSEMRRSMATEQAISASARIEFRQKLSGVQIGQLLSQLSVTALPDPVKALQLLLFMSNRRQPKSSNRGAAFWLDPKIQKWNKCKESSLVIINGTWKTRFHLQNFCVKSIAILRDAKCPVIWALKYLNPDQAAGQIHVSTIDLLKYIISQAISINESLHTDSALIPCLTAHYRAESEEDWITILASVLQGIPLLYIMIDVEVISKMLGTLTKDFWPAAFIRMFSKLSARNIGTIVKVALISYGSPLLKGPFNKDCQDLVVTIGGIRQTRASLSKPRSQRFSIAQSRRRFNLEVPTGR